MATTTSLLGATQQRVLDIPEILELIFTFLDAETNTVNALVCRKWSELALNNVWRDVSDLRRLFSLLAPMRNAPLSRYDRTYRDEYTFTRSLDVNDWERFKFYARRVRSLSLDEDEDSICVAKEAFDEIGRARVTLNVLPNLRSLTWVTHSIDRMRLSLMFQHENITDFSVFLLRTTTYPISTFFQEVRLRMPLLKVLDLRFKFPAREVEDDLIDLFNGLPRLRKVVLPLFTFTSRVFAALSTHQELDTVQFEFMATQGGGDIQDVVHFDPQLREGAFPLLADLSLSANIVDATRFLRGTFAPRNLTTLFLHTLSASSPAETFDFLTAVAESCRVLNRLFLDFFTSAEIRSNLTTPSITWQTLRPILSCAKLVEFEVRWDRAFEITQDDVEEMAAKWPTLETLLLNCEPMHVPTPTTLDLRALIPFALHCPNIAEVGLYLSGAVDFDPADVAPVTPFKTLRRICFGTSPLTNPGPAALFLSQLCPLGCEVSSGITWPDGFAIRDDVVDETALDDLNRQATTWFNSWKEVQRTLPLLTQLRMQERARRDALEKEVEDLRIRQRLMADMRSMGLTPKSDGTCIVS